jgi:hypothetical protein
MQLDNGQSVEDALMEIVRRAFPTRDEEVRRLREALGDDLENPDADLLPTELRPRESPIDHDTLRALMPVLDPPLSATVVSERDDRV